MEVYKLWLAVSKFLRLIAIGHWPYHNLWLAFSSCQRQKQLTTEHYLWRAVSSSLRLKAIGHWTGQSLLGQGVFLLKTHPSRSAERPYSHTIWFWFRRAHQSRSAERQHSHMAWFWFRKAHPDRSATVLPLLYTVVHCCHYCTLLYTIATIVHYCQDRTLFLGTNDNIVSTKGTEHWLLSLHRSIMQSFRRAGPKHNIQNRVS